MYRYQRQIILDELGLEGQKKLLAAKVLVIGAGGLGCPALQYLTAAGIGTIGILDFDTIEITNLNRQILYHENDINKPKAVTAKQKLALLNSTIKFIVHQLKIENTNALSVIKEYDLVLDCTDNFSTRYLINDACVILNKPLIYGAILKFEGQVAVFNLQSKTFKNKTNYRDLFPQPPDADTVQSCSEAGVLGVLPGIIGTMQAAEAIKIITGMGQPLSNQLFTYNAWNNAVYTFEISTSETNNILMPTDEDTFLQFNYDLFCNFQSQNEISIAAFEQLRLNQNITIIDVREWNELPEVKHFSHLKIPLSDFEKSIDELINSKQVILFCQSGNRSLKAMYLLSKRYPSVQVYSLKGGIAGWLKTQK